MAGDPAAAAPGIGAEATAFLAGLLSPYCAQALLQPPPGLLDGAIVEQSRLFSLYTLQVQRQVLTDLATAGIAAIAIKGFAHAHLHYPRPEMRMIGDLDIVVARADIGAVIDAMRPRGLQFGAAHKPRWGFISDASFIPFHSPDGLCNIDLHIEPDAYPLHRGLDATLLRAQARTVPAGPLRVLMPSATHQLMLLVSNAAKDRFFPMVLRKLIDAAFLLRSEGSAVDWPALAAIARRAQLAKALAVMLRLLLDLGLPAALLGEHGVALAARRGALYRHLLAQWQDLRTEPNALIGLLREPLLLYDFAAVLDRNRRRLAGLLRPQSGIPAQWRDAQPPTQ